MGGRGLLCLQRQSSKPPDLLFAFLVCTLLGPKKLCWLPGPNSALMQSSLGGTSSQRLRALAMSVFHASLKCLSRSKGHSAVAAAAYRAGVCGIDLRTGVVHDFSRRTVVTSAQIFTPPDAVQMSRFEYWNSAEAMEKRKNSTVARDLVLSLPWELPSDARTGLVIEMANWIVVRHQCLVDAAQHDPSKDNDPRNYHAHLLMSTRRLTAHGFAEKCRELDSRVSGPQHVMAWRTKWCELVNEALERYQIGSFVDHRSHRERGLYIAPTVCVGRGPDAEHRRRRNEELQRLNADLIASINCIDSDAAANEVDDVESFQRYSARNRPLH